MGCWLGRDGRGVSWIPDGSIWDFLRKKCSTVFAAIWSSRFLTEHPALALVVSRACAGPELAAHILLRVRSSQLSTGYSKSTSGWLQRSRRYGRAATGQGVVVATRKGYLSSGDENMHSRPVPVLPFQLQRIAISWMVEIGYKT